MNEKISEKPIREEKIKKLKEKIYSEIDNVTKRTRREMRALLSDGIDKNEELKKDWDFLVTREFCLARLRDFIADNSAFQTIEAEYPDLNVVIYQVSDEYLNIWLRNDYNFALNFLGEIEYGKIFDVYEILNDRYFGYEFVSTFEAIIYREKN